MTDSFRYYLKCNKRALSKLSGQKNFKCLSSNIFFSFFMFPQTYHQNELLVFCLRLRRENIGREVSGKNHSAIGNVKIKTPPIYENSSFHHGRSLFLRSEGGGGGGWSVGSAGELYGLSSSGGLLGHLGTRHAALCMQVIAVPS